MKAKGSQKRDKFHILTNDPSLTAWGWAVVDSNGLIVETGCIKTKPSSRKLRIRKGDDRTRRIQEINVELLRIIDKWDIQYILSELPHGAQNASAAIMIGMVTAIVQTIGDCIDCGVEWYSQADAKKMAGIKNKSSKHEMIKRMGEIYDPALWYKGVKYIDEGVADALAIHNAARKASPTLRFM